MDELDSQLTSVIESPEAGAKPENGTPEVNQDWDYTKDKRWAGDKPTGLWKSEKDIYRAYRELEKTHSPLQKQFKEYQETFKKYEVPDVKKASEIFEEYKKLKSPDYEINQFIDYLNPILSNEDRAKQLRATIDKMRKDIEKEQFGSNLSDEERQALIRAQGTEKQMQDLQLKLDTAEIKSKMQASLKDIGTYAKENDLEFDSNKFLEVCAQKGVPADWMLAFFKSEAIEAVKKHASRTSEERVLTNLEKTKSGGISGGAKVPVAASGGKKSLDNLLDGLSFLK